MAVTVVVAVKVYDGMVLAADSATALPLRDAAGKVTGHQVWNNADKVFHLHRDLPIGLATWGGGQIQSASISTLAKDLRRRLMGRDAGHTGWSLDPASYTLADVSERLVQLLHDELYSKIDPATAQYIGFLLAGFSGGVNQSEAWEIALADPNQRPVAKQVWDLSASGWRAYGQPEAIGRLFNGFAPSLQVAVSALVPPTASAALDAAFLAEGRPAVIPSMPFGDAIQFAKFCADTTIGYTRFLPGPDLVGGPVDVAGISRHEGFKWVHRKHYYNPELNPRRPHEHDQ